MNQNVTIKNNAQINTQIKTAKYYFLAVGLMSFIWLLLFVNSNPQWIQTIKEKLRLTPKLVAHDNSFYNSRIDPIFEKYCIACHDGNKDKGQLRLDSFRQLSFSGRSKADLTLAENNLLIERMTLPATNRLAMPPYGRERHKDHELALIELWLSKGGSGQLTEADFPLAPAKAHVIKFDDIDWQKIDDTRATYKADVKNLQHIFPHSIDYLARTSHLLTMNFSLHRPKITDNILAQITVVTPIIAQLNLTNTNISDDSLTLLNKMVTLQEINVAQTNITSKSLHALVALPYIQKVFADKSIITPSIQNTYANKGITLISVQRR